MDEETMHKIGHGLLHVAKSAGGCMITLLVSLASMGTLITLACLFIFF